VSVADDTALITLAETPTYGYVLLRQLALDRRILVVPTIALMVAEAHAEAGDFSEIHTARTVVRWVNIDAENAHRIAAEVPIGPDPVAWPIVAPVVWVSTDLRIPVLTREPRRYAGYDVQIEQMP
jgi:hypothetical protein